MNRGHRARVQGSCVLAFADPDAALGQASWTSQGRLPGPTALRLLTPHWTDGNADPTHRIVRANTFSKETARRLPARPGVNQHVPVQASLPLHTLDGQSRTQASAGDTFATPTFCDRVSSR